MTPQNRRNVYRLYRSPDFILELTAGGPSIYSGDPASFHDWEFKTRLRFRCTPPWSRRRLRKGKMSSLQITCSEYDSRYDCWCHSKDNQTVSCPSWILTIAPTRHDRRDSLTEQDLPAVPFGNWGRWWSYSVCGKKVEGHLVILLSGGFRMIRWRPWCQSHGVFGLWMLDVLRIL